MLEQLGWRRPLVRFKLPRLARREHGHDTIPVVGLEVRGAVDQDEQRRFALRGGVDGSPCCERRRLRGIGYGAQRALDLEEVGACGFGEGVVVWWDVVAVREEGFDIRHAEEGRGGGGDEDDRDDLTAGAGG